MSSDELDVVKSTDLERLTSEDRPEVSVGTVKESEQPSRVVSELTDRMVASKSIDPQAIKPMSYWNESIKKVFNSLPPSTRKVWVNTVQKSENIHRRLSEQLKKDYAVWDQVNEILAPQYDRLVQQKISLPAYIHALVQLETLMLKDPKKFILDMLVHFKFRPEDVKTWVEPYIGVVKKEKEFAPLEKKIADLEYKLAQATAPQQVSKDVLMDGQVIAQELQYFFTQKDANGQLLYPRFTEVAYLMPEMNAIYGTEDYASLYELACLKKDGGQMPDPKLYDPNIKYYSQKDTPKPYNPKSNNATQNVEQPLPDLFPIGQEDQTYEQLVAALSEEWDVKHAGQ
jgi:hypothetical protein